MLDLAYDFQWLFYPLVFLRIIGQYTFSSFVLSNTALTIIMILFSKKCFIVVHFSLSHSLSRIVLGRKKGDREIYVPANSSLFICFFWFVRKSWEDDSEVCNGNVVHSGKAIDYLIKLLSFLYVVVIITMASSNGLFHCLIILQHDKFKWFRAHCAN